MRFDELGLPIEENSSDKQDSARLAGLLILFNWPNVVIDLTHYVNDKSQYVRHPLEYKYDFSRDQFICLISGLKKRKLYLLVDEKMITGRDFLSPTVKGHIKNCKGLKSNWFENLFLCADILFHAKVTPTDESNQLICMMLCNPDLKYLKLWTTLNKNWQKSITKYWIETRAKPEIELAYLMITTIEDKINGN